jgi:hypothetical protein
VSIVVCCDEQQAELFRVRLVGLQACGIFALHEEEKYNMK